MAKPIRAAEPLFPILNQPSAPTGIARMALESTHADDGHLIEFRALKVRSILSRISSKRMVWMAWGINPYRGCEFACRYCYARYTHEFMAPAPDRNSTPKASQPDFHDPLTFERLIFLAASAAHQVAARYCCAATTFATLQPQASSFICLRSDLSNKPAGMKLRSVASAPVPLPTV